MNPRSIFSSPILSTNCSWGMMGRVFRLKIALFILSPKTKIHQRVHFHKISWLSLFQTSLKTSRPQQLSPRMLQTIKNYSIYSLSSKVCYYDQWINYFILNDKEGMSVPGWNGPTGECFIAVSHDNQLNKRADGSKEWKRGEICRNNFLLRKTSSPLRPTHPTRFNDCI